MDERWKISGLFLLGIAVSASAKLPPLLIGLSSATLILLIFRPKQHIFFTLTSLTLIATLPIIISQLILNGSLTQSLPIIVRSLTVSWLALAAISPQPPSRTFAALGKLGLPRVITQLLHFAHRFIQTMTNEMKRTRLAMAARGFFWTSEISKLPGLVQNAGLLVGGVFIRSQERSDRVYLAMKSRGFNGEFALNHPFCTQKKDIAYFALFSAVTLLIFAMNFDEISKIFTRATG